MFDIEAFANGFEQLEVTRVIWSDDTWSTNGPVGVIVRRLNDGAVRYCTQSSDVARFASGELPGDRD